MYQIDRAGLELIASFEGYVDGAYNDSRGFATCGYGHLLHFSGATEADHREYDGRGHEFYLALLKDDVQRDAIGPMNRVLRVRLNQNQVNAVASACYNCGPGFVEGIVGRSINTHNFLTAANDFMLWANPPELFARRREERTLFLRPEPFRKPYLWWLTPEERSAVEEYDRLHKANKNHRRQTVLKMVMIGLRKSIYLAAEHCGGWDLRNRRQRYHSLLIRTI